MRTCAIFLGALALLLMNQSSRVWAQATHTFSDIDCAQSKVVAAAGLKCRKSNDIAGSSSAKLSSKSGQGLYQLWNVYGSKDGVRYFYQGDEGLGPQSSKRIYLSLEDEIKNISPEAKRASGFTATAQSSGGDYLRFVGEKNEQCIAIRKLGPAFNGGYKWAIHATKCVPSGKQISEADVGQFIIATDFRL